MTLGTRSHWIIYIRRRFRNHSGIPCSPFAETSFLTRLRLLERTLQHDRSCYTLRTERRGRTRLWSEVVNVQCNWRCIDNSCHINNCERITGDGIFKAVMSGGTTGTCDGQTFGVAHEAGCAHFGRLTSKTWANRAFWTFLT